MESKAKALGHPIHQMLIPFPLGLLGTAVIFDIIFLIWGNPTMAVVAHWMMAAGVIGGLVAAPFGLIDWTAIPRGTRANRIGILHGLGNLIMLLLFAGSWYLRYSVGGINPYVPGNTALALSFSGFILVSLTGWLGGELVDRLSVGVDEGANLQAPNSLTGPARRTAKAERHTKISRAA